MAARRDRYRGAAPRHHRVMGAARRDAARRPRRLLGLPWRVHARGRRARALGDRIGPGRARAPPVAARALPAPGGGARPAAHALRALRERRRARTFEASRLGQGGRGHGPACCVLRVARCGCGRGCHGSARARRGESPRGDGARAACGHDAGAAPRGAGDARGARGSSLADGAARAVSRARRRRGARGAPHASGAPRARAAGARQGARDGREDRGRHRGPRARGSRGAARGRCGPARPRGLRARRRAHAARSSRRGAAAARSCARGLPRWPRPRARGGVARSARAPALSRRQARGGRALL